MGEGVWGLILSTKSQKSKDIALAAAETVEARPGHLLNGTHGSLGETDCTHLSI